MKNLKEFNGFYFNENTAEKVMKTNYTINEAHSGTNANEIAKAKRLLLEGVKKGMYRNPGDVIIKFSDVNYKIHATFINANDGGKLNTVEI